MPYCAEYCLEMPDDFPAVELTEFMAAARQVLIPGGTPSPQWSEFAGASNLIGWRYRGSADAWLEHKASIEQGGGGRNHEDLYKQELALFVMFSAGVACIESTSYALAAAASHSSVCAFKFGTKEQRACSPLRLSDWLSPYPRAVDLKFALGRLSEASEWKFWVELRNRMTHRSNLPRRLFGSIGAPAPKVKPLNYAPTSSTPDIDADLADWDALHKWLASSLRELLTAGTVMLRGGSLSA